MRIQIFLYLEDEDSYWYIPISLNQKQKEN